MTMASLPRQNVPAGAGVTLIAAERLRQAVREGWTPAHDDCHQDGEMACAAACYAGLPVDPDYDTCVGPPAGWPWERHWWKPTPGDRVRELVKAGALIAAEIDRLQRAGRGG